MLRAFGEVVEMASVPKNVEVAVVVVAVKYPIVGLEVAPKAVADVQNVRVLGEPPERAACFPLKVFQSVPVKHPVTPDEALVQAMVAAPPTTDVPAVTVMGPVAERVPVATLATPVEVLAA